MLTRDDVLYIQKADSYTDVDKIIGCLCEDWLAYEALTTTHKETVYMDTNNKQRFGFQVSEETAKKFLAVLEANKRVNPRFNKSDNFAAMVDLAYSQLPVEEKAPTEP